MANLFSIFDPQASFSWPLNWLSCILVIMWLPVYFWVSENQSKIFFKKITYYVKGELFSVFKTSPPGSLLFLLALFWMILLNNFSGLMPYIFTATSHISISVAFALPLWLGHILMGWWVTTSNMLSHLVPLGTPAPLIAFMVIIELVSNIIRPLTLSVRLAANMVAGHLLLALLSNQASALNPSISTLTLLCLLPLIILETAVAIIQSYVFSVLSTLYLSEVASPQLS